MDNFWSSLRQAFGHLGTIRVMDIVDILLVAAFFYFLITLVRRTKTNKLFQGIVYILLALWLSGEMQLYTVNYILRNAVQVGLLALVVLFQPEIRRFFGKARHRVDFLPAFGRAAHTECRRRHYADGACLCGYVCNAHRCAHHL